MKNLYNREKEREREDPVYIAVRILLKVYIPVVVGGGRVAEYCYVNTVSAFFTVVGGPAKMMNHSLFVYFFLYERFLDLCLASSEL